MCSDLNVRGFLAGPTKCVEAQLRDRTLAFDQAEPGANRLRLQLVVDDDAELSLTGELQITPGVHRVDLPLPTAKLFGILPPGTQGTSRLLYRVDLRAPLPWTQGVVRGEVVESGDGPSFDLRVPAGSGTLLREIRVGTADAATEVLGASSLAPNDAREVQLTATQAPR